MQSKDVPASSSGIESYAGWGAEQLYDYVNNDDYLPKPRQRRLSEGKGWRLVDIDEYVEQSLDRLNELLDLLDVDGIDQVILIMLHFKWDDEAAFEYFDMSDEDKFKLGIEFDENISERFPETKFSLKSELENEEIAYCMICYEELTPDQEFSLKCQHTFCKACWLENLKDKINEGIDGLNTNCMQTSCNVKVGHSDFLRILGDED